MPVYKPNPGRPALAFSLFAATVLSSAAALAQAPEAAPAHPPAPTATPSTAEAKAPPNAPAHPQSALTPGLLYRFLVSEISFQRGDARTGVNFMLDAARRTGDEGVFQRAADMSLQARAGQAALEVVGAWLRAHPESPVALRYQLQTLLLMGRAGETVQPLKTILPLLDEGERNAIITALPAIYGRLPNAQQALDIVTQALQEATQEPASAGAAWATVGRMHMQAGDVQGALHAAREGARLAPDSEWPARLALQLWAERHSDEAESLASAYLARPDAAADFGVAYALALRELGRRGQWRAMLADWARAHPDSDKAWLAHGLALAETAHTAQARQALAHYLRVAPEHAPEADRNDAYTALAELAERRADWPQAMQWLDKVQVSSEGETHTLMLARARLLARQGQMKEALRLVRQLPDDTPQTARARLLVEGSLLHSEGLPRAAYALLRSGLEKNPRDGDLLYETALVAEKLGEMAESERLLRKLIALRPKSPHGYNALGFMLADQGVRLPEARALIEKAVGLAPDDPFIQDSLGWVAFRQGDVALAHHVLQAAYEKRPHAEIAAHLGEVLWTQGEREQALALWQQARQLDVRDATLAGTLKRLNITLPEPPADEDDDAEISDDEARDADTPAAPAP